MFSPSRVLMALVTILNWARLSEASFEPDCALLIRQGLCSTYYAQRLEVCLRKLSDPNQLTWDPTRQHICAVLNPKLCISARICKNTAQSKNVTASREALKTLPPPEVTTTTTASTSTTPEVTTTTTVSSTTTPEVTMTTTVSSSTPPEVS